MKAAKVALLLLALLIGATTVNPVVAQTFNKRTKIKFSQPVEIPGRVLPAGAYTFTVMDAAGMRNIVQIWNEDKTDLIATVMGIFDYRAQPTGETVITFKETPAGSPQAVKSWFYPGYNYGIAFVYPKEEAVQLAQASNEVVPAETATVEPTPSNVSSTPLVAETPKGQEEPITQEFPSTPPAEEKVVAKTLPKTATPLPLIRLLGTCLILAGLGLRRLAARTR